MKTDLLHPRAVKLWESCFSPEDKILISGATGWFGRTALALSENLPLLLVGSRENNISIGKNEKTFRVVKPDVDQIRKFEPTVYIDAAFLTRGHSETMPLESYMKQNQLMMKRSLSIANLPSIKRFLSFSSGASVAFGKNPDSDPALNPYGYLKYEWEKAVQKFGQERRDLASVIIRPWSVSGIFVRNPNGYAFSDFIHQVNSGKIDITAKNFVYRRYTSVEDLLAVSIATSRGFPNEVKVVDSGGDLVEIGELARTVSQLLNPKATLNRALADEPFKDIYASDNSIWKLYCEKYSFVPQSLNQQILSVSRNYNNYWID